MANLAAPRGRQPNLQTHAVTERSARSAAEDGSTAATRQATRAKDSGTPPSSGTAPADAERRISADADPTRISPSPDPPVVFGNSLPGARPPRADGPLS